MTFFQAIILGIIQGITEFLPISSSGHLVIIPYLLGWKLPDDQIFIFDVLIQIATLIALIVFYWKDLTQISHAMLQEIRRKKFFADVKARTGWLTLIATVPAGIAGLVFRENIEDAFTSPVIVGALLIITALLMALSEKIGKKNKRLRNLNWFDAIVVGISQALSIFPGISRSGSTISGGLLNNLDRKTAGQFAFLMAIPIMTAASILSIIDLFRINDLYQFIPILGVGFITSGIVGFFTIRWLLGYITNHSLLPFAIYCLILGSGTLTIAATNQDLVGFSDNTVVRKEKTYHISYSSSTQWLLPKINECSSKIPGTSIILKRSENGLDENEDVYISFGELASTHQYSFQIGSDILVLAAHQNNPINHLTLSSFNSLYQEEISTFNELIEDCNECDISKDGEINLTEKPIFWNYPEESVFYDSIRNSFQINNDHSNHSIAPTTSIMIQALSNDSRSIGFLPMKSIREPIKKITIDDLPGENASTPIIATNSTELDEVLSSLLVCIQEKVDDK